MKKLLFIGLVLLSITSCSFVKDVQAHCKVTPSDVNALQGSFNVCLKCDSLASVVKTQIARAQAAKAAK